MSRYQAWRTLVAMLIVVPLSCTQNPHFMGGKNYVKQEVWGKAVDELEIAVKEQPSNAEAYYYLGWAYCETGDFKGAGSAFDEAKALSAKAGEKSQKKVVEFWNDLAARGQDLKDGGRYEEASQKFEWALQLRPDHVSTYVFAADIDSRMGNIDKAVAKYRKALELGPENDTTLVNFAKLLEENDRYEETIPVVQKLIELDPEDMSLKPRLAHLHRLAGHEKEALAVYRELGDPSALFQDARDAFDKEDYAAAEELYRNAREVSEPGSQDYFDAFFNMMICTFKLEEWEEGIEMGEKLVEEEPDDPQYWKLLGNCYRNVKRAEDALRAYKKADELEQSR